MLYIHHCILLHKDIEQEWGSGAWRTASNKHGDKLMRTLPSSHSPPTHTHTVIINRKEAWNNITHNWRTLCLSVIQSSSGVACVHFFYRTIPFFFSVLFIRPKLELVWSSSRGTDGAMVCVSAKERRGGIGTMESRWGREGIQQSKTRKWQRQIVVERVRKDEFPH